MVDSEGGCAGAGHSGVIEPSVVSLEFDHAFICCSPGAPEGDALVRLGLTEGSPNTHPGQGTANRRFFFGNAFLELLWVADPEEARSEPTRRTRLWERWSGRASNACPFGIVFRSKDTGAGLVPFPTWAYRPAYLPPGLAIGFADGVPLDEPELVHVPFVHRSGAPGREPTGHALPFREVCGVTIGVPGAGSLSQPSQAVSSAGLVTYRRTPQHVMELAFPSARDITCDLRPTLPLLLRGVMTKVA